jgi:hypothetical protein
LQQGDGGKSTDKSEVDTNTVGGCKGHDGYFGPSYNLLHYTSRVLHKLTALDVQTVSQIITAQLTSRACDHYSEDLNVSVRKMSFCHAMAAETCVLYQSHED